jgi:hypothetical protein
MNEETPWKYKPDSANNGYTTASGDNNVSSPSKPSSSQSVSWEASEFIEHHHGMAWFLALFLCTVAMAALVFLIARDYIASGTIVIVGIIVGVFAAQKPGPAKYEITDAGLAINGKIYNYGNYKSFAVIKEGSLSSLNLFPLKRLMPPLSAYFNPADEPKIMNAVGRYLPYEDRQLDAVERLARRLRL